MPAPPIPISCELMDCVPEERPLTPIAVRLRPIIVSKYDTAFVSP